MLLLLEFIHLDRCSEVSLHAPLVAWASREDGEALCGDRVWEGSCREAVGAGGRQVVVGSGGWHQKAGEGSASGVQETEASDCVFKILLR